MAPTPDQIRRELDGIADKHGGALLPEHVVLEAQAPSHLLHERFEWDDARAGHAHRIEQARTLIRSVRVEVRIQELTVKTVAYVQNPANRVGEAGYISLPRVQSDEEMSRAVVAQEFGRALAALQRARNVAAALGLGESIDELVYGLERLADAVPTLRVA
jgi:flagellar basal body rod protein FlgC